MGLVLGHRRTHGLVAMESEALELMSQKDNNLDYWLSMEGQKASKQKEKERRRDRRSSLNIFDYSAATKASLCPVSPAQEDEWYEVELTADTGAPPSLQGMEYEVAAGQSISLGEERCEMWTEGASQPKTIKMQVADVYTALPGLSRCEDAGFESRFGVTMGCLTDTATDEVRPLHRRGNLYILLKAWI